MKSIPSLSFYYEAYKITLCYPSKTRCAKSSRVAASPNRKTRRALYANVKCDWTRRSEPRTVEQRHDVSYNAVYQIYSFLILILYFNQTYFPKIQRKYSTFSREFSSKRKKKKSFQVAVASRQNRHGVRSQRRATPVSGSP